MPYDPANSEPRWQKAWDDAGTFRAIRDERKLLIDYRDELANATERTVRPLALHPACQITTCTCLPPCW